MDNKPKQEDILNAILPPREWIEQGKCELLGFLRPGRTYPGAVTASVPFATI